MRILHLSDTHGKHHLLNNLPNADVIVHSGDVANTDTEEEVLGFLTWFFNLNYPHKIFVAGNHDDCLYGRKIENLPPNCYYLCHSGVHIEGINFWGVPHFIEDQKQEEQMEQLLAKIPIDTGILISHMPSYGILDLENGINHGSLDLLNVVLKIKPTYHLFGHIHSGYGIEYSSETVFSNASLLNVKDDLLNKSILLEI